MALIMNPPGPSSKLDIDRRGECVGGVGVVSVESKQLIANKLLLQFITNNDSVSKHEKRTRGRRFIMYYVLLIQRFQHYQCENLLLWYFGLFLTLVRGVEMFLNYFVPAAMAAFLFMT